MIHLVIMEPQWRPACNSRQSCNMRPRWDAWGRNLSKESLLVGGKRSLQTLIKKWLWLCLKWLSCCLVANRYKYLSAHLDDVTILQLFHTSALTESGFRGFTASVIKITTNIFHFKALGSIWCWETHVTIFTLNFLPKEQKYWTFLHPECRLGQTEF